MAFWMVAARLSFLSWWSRIWPLGISATSGGLELSPVAAAKQECETHKNRLAPDLELG